MPRTGPRRVYFGARLLTPDEHAAAVALAEAKTDGNLSELIRHLVLTHPEMVTVTRTDLRTKETTVSGVTMPEWEPDEPVNSRVISALIDAGVDPDSIWASPDHTWHVGEGDDSIAIGPSFDDSMNETWDASRGDELIESGDLAVVAAAVAKAVKP